MSAIVEYAGIPLDGSAASTRSLLRSLRRGVAQLARASGSPVPPKPEPPDDPDGEADPEPSERR